MMGMLIPPPHCPKECKYVPYNSFKRQERAHHSAVVINNNIILIGGMNKTGSSTGEFVMSESKVEILSALTLNLWYKKLTTF